MWHRKAKLKSVHLIGLQIGPGAKTALIQIHSNGAVQLLIFIYVIPFSPDAITLFYLTVQLDFIVITICREIKMRNLNDSLFN